MPASVRRYGKSSRAYCGVQGSSAVPLPRAKPARNLRTKHAIKQNGKRKGETLFMRTFLKRYSFIILLLLIALLYLTRFTTLSAENAVRRAVFAEGYPFSACFLQARKATEGDFVDRVFASLPENENIYIVTSHVPKDFCTHALLRHWLVTETEGHYKAAYLPPA